MCFVFIYDVMCYVLMCYMCGKLERGQAETGVRSICASLLLIRAAPNIFYLSKVLAILYFRPCFSKLVPARGKFAKLSLVGILPVYCSLAYC